MATLKLSVVAAALGGEPREAVRLSRAAGFAGLQFDAFSPALRLPDLSRTGRREFLQVLSAQDQALVGLRVDLGPKGFGPGADVDRLLMNLDRVLEATAGLMAGAGVPLVAVDVGPLPEPPREKTAGPRVTPEQAGFLILPPSLIAAPAPGVTSLTEIPPAVDPVFVAQVEAAMADLGARADRYGVMVAFRSELSSFAALERAVRQSNCPWFGIDLDPVAVLCDRWDADEIFSRLGPLIRHVRGRDANVGSEKRTRPAAIGRGDVSWGELLARLDETGYHGWLTVDPIELADRPAAAAAALAHLRKLNS